jgi:hypothetical protein
MQREGQVAVEGEQKEGKQNKYLYLGGGTKVKAE